MSATLSANAQKTLTFGLIAKSQGNPVFQAARVGAMDAAKDLGKKYGLNIKIDWRTPNEEDAQKQAESIEQARPRRGGWNRGEPARTPTS